MKYFKKIVYKECFSMILTLEAANGYSATYKESPTSTITFSKGYYNECVENGKIIRG